MRQALGKRPWHAWVALVLPTSLVFLISALILRAMVREQIAALDVLPHGSHVEAFDAAFPGFYIAAGFGVALLVATLITTMIVVAAHRSLDLAMQRAANLPLGLSASDHPPQTSGDLVKRLESVVTSLERADQNRKEQVHHLAHELRGPLTHLQGYLEALRDGVIDPDPNAFDEALAEVLRLTRLMEPLYQLARVDAFCQMPHAMRDLVPTCLDGLVDHLVRMIRPMSETRHITVSTSFGGKAPVAVNADAISQVMRNLLHNAIQYANEGGQVWVETGITRQAYRFVCRNTGPGISPEDLPHLFLRFYRGSTARQSGVSGVGVGLAIAKQLVEAQGGRIGAESHDGLTTFWFELPLVAAPEPVDSVAAC
ncbi:MAG: sensor histidine kinase [Mycobacterium leprae]